MAIGKCSEIKALVDTQLIAIIINAVLATKYTTNYKAGPGHPHQMANFTGNGAKSLHMSVEASLKKLQTDYIDLVGYTA